MKTILDSSTNPKRIAIVIGKAKTDLYLVNAVLKHYPDLEIIQLKRPSLHPLKYYFKKFYEYGVFYCVGVKLLRGYLEMEVLLEKLFNKCIWKKCGLERPDNALWISTIKVCYDTEELSVLVRPYKVVIITKALRLSDKFFYSKSKILQVNNGKFPEFCGDNALFWAMLKKKEQYFSYSIIRRHKFFNNSGVLKFCPVGISPDDTLRTIYVKGVVSVGEALPRVIQEALDDQEKRIIKCSGDIQFYSFPTIYHYFKSLYTNKQHNHIPNYA